MKVLQVMATSGGMGGLEAHTFHLSQYISQGVDQEKIEVHVLVDLKYKPMQASLSQVHFHWIDFSRSRWNPILILQIYRLIKTIQPDVIHAQGGKAARMVALLLPWLNTKSVATVHGMKNHLRDYRRFDQIIAVSGKVAEKFQVFPNVAVIYNGVVTQSLEKTIQAPRQRAIAIGRLETVKGFDHLIQAWVGIDFDLDIYGEGSERQHLEQLIQQHNLQDRVRLMGQSSQVNVELLDSRFLVISSIKEGGPLVMAEALLLGIPVISTDVGMVGEFIPQKYITKDQSVEELHQLILKAVKNVDQLKLDFNEGFMQAEQQLNIEAMCQKTQHLYQRLITSD